MTTRNRLIAGALAGSLMLGLALAPNTVSASEEGRRNTALALGAATVYFMMKGQKTPALITGAGTAYATKLLQDDIDKRHRRERSAAVASAYRRGTLASKSSVSSAYKKGVALGYDSGYKKGLAEGRRLAALSASRTATTQPARAPAPPSTYERVLLARK